MSVDLPPTLSAEELLRCTELLERIAGDALLLSKVSDADRVRLFIAAGKVIYPDRTQVRRRVKAMRKQKNKDREAKDRVVRAATSIRSARRESVFIPPPKVVDSSETASAQASTVGELEKSRLCYVCKAEFKQVHFFYDSMCPVCAKFNYEKRFQTASLEGRVAIITGARMKIGYQAALMMLRAGARVIVTTRFPQDSAERFSREQDFSEWSNRLQIYGLDLRHSPSVEAFTAHMNRSLERLDILINNAAQTVRRPPGFYAHLMEIESTPHDSLPEKIQSVLKDHEAFKQALHDGSAGISPPEKLQWVSDWHDGKITSPETDALARTPSASPLPGLTHSAALSQIPYQCDEPANSELFPEGRYDADLQQVDQRKMNSWRMALADVPTSEMLEVQLVNSVAPFILCSKLKPLMERSRTDQKHIVNVSAMEGKFSRHTKTDKHPHTNMAKAALNMMTLTSARDYVKSGIFMNAVDTGWVTDEDPAEISNRKQTELDFQPPLDIVDGAARVMDPVFAGLLSGKHSWGNFLKDYYPTEW